MSMRTNGGPKLIVPLRGKLTAKGDAKTSLNPIVRARTELRAELENREVR